MSVCSRSMAGVPALIVCDNLKAGVISPHRYEPEANRTYEDLAEHYGCAILPARGAQAQGQGQSGEGRAGCRAAHSRASAASHLLLTP